MLIVAYSFGVYFTDQNFANFLEIKLIHLGTGLALEHRCFQF